jgi:hypothetical protein
MGMNKRWISGLLVIGALGIQRDGYTGGLSKLPLPVQEHNFNQEPIIIKFPPIYLRARA